MPWNWGLLSDQSLSNQPPEVQQGLQEQATKQFLLNTIFGGGVMSGLNAAQAVPEQYQAAVEQRALDRQLAQARRSATENIMGEAAGPAMPGEAPPQMVVGQKLNPEAYLQQLPAVLAQAGTRAKTGNIKEFADLFGKTANTLKDGYIVSPAGNIVGVAPRVDAKEGIVTTGQVVNGQPVFQMSSIPGARSARAEAALPTLAPGEEYVFDANRNIVGIRNVAGSVQALGQREGTKTSATEAEKIVPVTMADGSIQYRRQGDIVQGRAAQPSVAGQPTAPAMRPQTAYDIPLQGAFANALKKAQTDADMAGKQGVILDQLQVGLNNFPTGAFAQQKAAITSALSGIGVTGQRADQMLTGYTQLRTGLSDFTANNIQDLSGATSDKDIAFTKERFGQITDTKNALQFQIDMQRAINKKRIEKYDYLSQNAGPDAERNWKNSSGSTSIFESPELRKYLPQKQTKDGRTAYKSPSGEWVVFD